MPFLTSSLILSNCIVTQNGGGFKRQTKGGTSLRPWRQHFKDNIGARSTSINNICIIEMLNIPQMNRFPTVDKIIVN